MGGKEIAVLSHPDSVVSVAFSPNGRTLATTGANTMRVSDLSTGKEIRIVRSPENIPRGVVFSLDGQMLANGSGDQAARLLEVATGKEIAVLRGHGRYVDSIAFSPDGQTLATGSDDRTARLWDVATGREIAVLRTHQEAVRSVAFSPTGDRRATGARQARFWEWGQRLIDLACARVHNLPFGKRAGQLRHRDRRVHAGGSRRTAPSRCA